MLLSFEQEVPWSSVGQNQDYTCNNKSQGETVDLWISCHTLSPIHRRICLKIDMSPEKRITLISYWLVCLPWLSSMIWKNNFKNKSKINNKPVDHVFVSKFRLRQWIYPIIVRGKYIDELQSCSVRSKINLMAMEGETRHVHSGKVRLCYASVHIGCLLRYVDSKQKKLINWIQLCILTFDAHITSITEESIISLLFWHSYWNVLHE